MDLGLGGKTAIVTGGSKGIGRAITLELAAESANVVCVARDETSLAECAALATGLAGTVTPVSQDCGAKDAPFRIVTETLETLGRIDVLVNNVGVGWPDHDWATDDEVWEAMININLYSAVRLTREAIPHMLRLDSGRIVNISSAGAHTGLPRMGDYNAAKAGMIAWSKTLSHELAPSITVNSVCPASFDTPLTRLHASVYATDLGNTVEEVFDTYAGRNLSIGRFGDPTEVSGLVAFLASTRASFITGVSYNVDGGYTKFAF